MCAARLHRWASSPKPARLAMEGPQGTAPSGVADDKNEAASPMGLQAAKGDLFVRQKP
jgi:hypothetical protein